ncbi:hypothetical protein [Shimazuella alba]|uniref:Uncharacterized protein n=1 Tax=Shimazuella alba TaxID=2690964 RepID=A0A6I4W3M6_9BACL|nr:hypothetical protein [Shimazuella alba]MXQ55384.1 hypothetical protein [Shimazuella alba]
MTTYNREDVLKVVEGEEPEAVRLFELVTAELENRTQPLTFDQLVELVAKHADLSSEQINKYLPITTPLRFNLVMARKLQDDGLYWLEPIIVLLTDLLLEKKGVETFKSDEFHQVTSGYFTLKLK